MQKQDSYQLQGNAPQIYETQKAPAMFRPLAEATLRHVDVREGARVLGAACGTGIVGRLVAEKVGKSGFVAGFDLNVGMIEIAKQSAPDANIEWRQADVIALPFPDSSFDMAFCQQGLQFFPDKLAALNELQRVLAPGATMILTVWSAATPMRIAIAAALTRYLNAEIAKSSLAPYAFRDPEVIKALLTESGFRAIKIEALTIDRQLRSTDESIESEIRGTPYWNDVFKLDKMTQDSLVSDVVRDLQDYRKGDGFAIPQHTHLIRATA